MTLQNLVGALLAISFASASAQTLYHADVVSHQPTINRDHKGVKSCGIRLIVVSMSKENASIAYDFSVNLWDSGDGMMKAGTQTIAFTKTKTGEWRQNKMTVRQPGPNSFWVAQRDQNLSLRPVKYIKGDDPGYVLGGVDGGDALKMMHGMLSGEPMQVSLQYANDRYDRIVAFNNKMSDEDRAAVSGCLSGLVSRMEKEVTP